MTTPPLTPTRNGLIFQLRHRDLGNGRTAYKATVLRGPDRKLYVTDEFPTMEQAFRAANDFVTELESRQQPLFGEEK